MNAMGNVTSETWTVGDMALDVIRRGTGQPILLLHGMHNVDARAPFLDLLGQRAEIIAPSYPGFGHSPRPEGCDTVYDLVHLYLERLESLPYERVTLMGLSFGGWLAAEIAVTCCLGRSGFMTHAETEKNIRLFGQEVLPRLQAIAPIAVS